MDDGVSGVLDTMMETRHVVDIRYLTIHEVVIIQHLKMVERTVYDRIQNLALVITEIVMYHLAIVAEIFSVDEILVVLNEMAQNV